VELAVDKVLAVFGRAEARDFVDLMAIEERYGLERLFELAAEKDRGFTPELFAGMAARFDRLREDEFGLETQRYQELARQVTRWRERAQELAHQHHLGRDRGPGLGREL
jgi:hypothetical protein